MTETYVVDGFGFVTARDSCLWLGEQDLRHCAPKELRDCLATLNGKPVYDTSKRQVGFTCNARFEHGWIVADISGHGFSVQRTAEGHHRIAAAKEAVRWAADPSNLTDEQLAELGLMLMPNPEKSSVVVAANGEHYLIVRKEAVAITVQNAEQARKDCDEAAGLIAEMVGQAAKGGELCPTLDKMRKYVEEHIGIRLNENWVRPKVKERPRCQSCKAWLLDNGACPVCTMEKQVVRMVEVAPQGEWNKEPVVHEETKPDHLPDLPQKEVKFREFM